MAPAQGGFGLGAEGCVGVSLYQTLQSCGAPTSRRALGRVGRVARGCLAEGGRQGLGAGSEGPGFEQQEGQPAPGWACPAGAPLHTHGDTPGHAHGDTRSQGLQVREGPAHKQLVS